MSKDFSPISKSMGIIFLGIVIYAMFNLSYGWSMEQTQDFMSAVVGNEPSLMAAYLIQFAPQALLIIAAVAKMNGKDRMAHGLMAAAVAINLLDWYTNDVTFREWWPTWSQTLVADGRSIEFINATRPVGRVLAFLVTWFEEGISLALGAMLQLIAELMQGMGYRPPRFFRSGLVAAAGFDFRGVNKQARQQSSSRQQQPARHTSGTQAAHNGQRDYQVNRPQKTRRSAMNGRRR